jgi:hypothetical protein
MSTKADFNAEEWATLVEAPLLAGMRVVTAERGGTIRESIALGKTYAEARKAHGESELLDAVVASPPALDPGAVRKSGGDVKQLSETRLREAVGVLESKGSPEDAQSYKQFVVSVAEAVANAHREGGFAGIGGQAVSDGEKTALDEIRATLAL